MVQDYFRNLSSLRAACKQWSVGLAVAVLLAGAWGRLVPANLLWAAAPLVFLALADAAYAAQERRCAEFLAERTGRDEAKGVLRPETAARGVGRAAAAVLSLSVWPFYFGLAGVVVAGSRALPVPDKTAVSHFAPGPMQPYLQTTAGPMPLNGQMQPYNPNRGPQQAGPLPQTMPTRPPILQNLPARPPLNPAAPRTPPSSLGAVPSAGAVPSGPVMPTLPPKAMPPAAVAPVAPSPASSTALPKPPNPPAKPARTTIPAS